MNYNDELLTEKIPRKKEPHKISIILCVLSILIAITGILFQLFYLPFSGYILFSGAGMFTGYLSAKSFFQKTTNRKIFLNTLAIAVFALIIIRYQNFPKAVIIFVAITSVVFISTLLIQKINQK